MIGFEKEFKIIKNNLTEEKLNNSILISGIKGIGKLFFVTKIIEDSDDISGTLRKLMWANCKACHSKYRAPH